MDESTLLRRQVEEQRQTINQLVRVVNYHSNYLGEYRDAHNILFKRAAYWWMMWLKPVTLPLYKRARSIRMLGRPDDIPVLLPGPLHNVVPVMFDENAPQVFDDHFLSGEGE